ncbi:acyl-CoA synthetase [Polynucleobacter sp. TUM22923]|jgi:fatty-acyl-CoA synthase|uniref:acyl-CoA synthetase n=1 Tax=Polynucleobacter sp. TUM22923 TaxID=3022126 RepID=UPI002573BDB6|nr:acyl-CoA synthetase [Polynucleobacter sp. TUM22923]BDX21951.1 acyl-CoA synthetase [Polynucleobacter sp. TUM22923]
MVNIFEQGLERNPANYTPITPILFLERSAQVYPDRLAVIHGNLRQTWSQTYERCRRLASALQKQGIGVGDAVAVMLPNTPPMVEAHFGIPMAGAVLNALNTRLDPVSIAFMLNHGEAKVVIVDPEFADVMKKALEIAKRDSGRDFMVIDAQEKEFDVPGERLGSLTYEQFLDTGDPQFVWPMPSDEWQAICLNYTSGTTGNPKGVVYHHRGAAINAISNILDWDMNKHPVYLWTLPMFHCNGWCFPWTVAARAGVNVCLRRVDAEHIFSAIKNHGVTHYCAAPIVHNLLVNAPDALKVGVPAGVKGLIAGAAPPASIIEGMEKLGFDLTHVYGLTETYGPAAVCVQQEDWDDLEIGERARLNARQGVRYHLQQAIAVLDPLTLEPVVADGETMGEIMFKGNIAMKGYLKNEKASKEAFAGGWFHSGDLAVMNPDGYVKIKDRSKDIIISGGENISSIEVEDVLYRHPAVIAAAVVAKPDLKWGETPCAFLEIKAGAEVTAADIVAHCKQHLAGFKVPRAVVFGELPKTSTGKIQKFELRKRAGSASAIDV